MENLYIIGILVLFGYVALYFSGRKYLETFENRFKKDGSPVTDATIIVQPESSFSSNTATDARDMYDVSAVYNNQGSRQASKKQISDAMTRYPLDWSVQGSGSENFQEEQAKYEKKMQNVQQPAPYQLESTDMLLPDASSLDEEERKLLQTYKPESSKGLLHYSMHDVTHLLDKLYGKKGLIPVVKPSKQGNNVWEIVEVKEKNPTIVWEEPTTRDAMTMRGEDTIDVPYTAGDVAAGLDPFMKRRDRMRTGGNEIDENTELSRMFQPTYPVPEWN